MFQSFLRFGKVLVNSAIATSVDSLKKISDKIDDSITGIDESLDKNDPLAEDTVDPSVEKEISREINCIRLINYGVFFAGKFQGSRVS